MMSFILFIREMQWHNKSFDMLCFVFFLSIRVYILFLKHLVPLVLSFVICLCHIRFVWVFGDYDLWFVF